MPENAVPQNYLSTWLPLVISTLALSVSLGSFYYDHWRDKHSLAATVSSINWNSQQQKVSVEILLWNRGNKSEVLSEAQLIYGREDNGGGSVSSEHVGPLVADPGKPAILSFTVSRPAYRSLKDSKMLDSSNGLHIGVLFSIIDLRSHSIGGKLYIYKAIPFTVIHFDESGRFVGAKPSKENAESFVELYSGEQTE